jgi:hypothetical protein
MSEASNEFVAPLDFATAGRLEFTRGADNVTIHADASTESLYRARFEGAAPDIRVEEGVVRVAYPRSWNPLDLRGHSADVVLNPVVPWSFVVREGASRIDADMRGLRLEAFEIKGGVRDVRLTLPEPSGTVSISIEGGADDLKVFRPRGVAARVGVEGGASELVLDEQLLGAVGGDTTLESPGYSDAENRYEISVSGGSNTVTVAGS